MAVITPPTIVAAPTPPDRADRATFATRATASFDHLKVHAIPEIQAVANNVAANATDAATSATTATTQAGLATTNGAAQVTLATAQAIIATDKATLTSADRVQTGLDATATASDRIATSADRVQTGLDRAATASDHTAVNEALAALSVGPVLSVNDMGGVVVLGARTAYDDRNALRSTEDAEGSYRLVESLGLFRFYTGGDEPDDDETCFATSTGRWLLECPHWDVADAMRMADESSQDDRAEDAETRLTESETRLTESETRWPGRVLFGTGACSITSIATVTQVGFTATISGASVGDRVLATPPDELNLRVSCYARVTAPNTITIYLNNPSASSATLVAGTWAFAVFKEI